MPLIIYKNKDGERIPSFSTIKNQWGISTQPLMYWAYSRGEKGVPLYEKEEAEIGSLIHDMIDHNVKGKKIDLGQYPLSHTEQAQTAYKNYQKWKNQVSLEPLETELSLVSEKHQFGGTIDIIARVSGELSLLDVKSGKEVYPDAILQLAAYSQLWTENFPDYPLSGGFHIIRTGKEFPMFAHSYYGELPGAWEAFLHLRKLYDLHKKIKAYK